jgi:hypothetical protein
MFKDMIEFIYLEVKDGVVINRLLGSPNDPLTAENLVLQKYPVCIGWKQIGEDMFIPSTMTEEEWNILSVKTKQSVNSTKEYYDNFVKSEHYKNNIPEEVQATIQKFILDFNIVHEKINEHDGWILIYLDQGQYSEPLHVRPNLEIEV